MTIYETVPHLGEYGSAALGVWRRYRLIRDQQFQLVLFQQLIQLVLQQLVIIQFEQLFL